MSDRTDEERLEARQNDDEGSSRKGDRGAINASLTEAERRTMHTQTSQAVSIPHLFHRF